MENTAKGNGNENVAARKTSEVKIVCLFQITKSNACANWWLKSYMYEVEIHDLKTEKKKTVSIPRFMALQSANDP